MMKFSTTPSVFKGIYIVFLLIFTTTLSFSQNSKWEFGVGLRPLTLKEEPYSLILRRYISNKVALRVGISFIYKEKNDYIEYIHPYVSDSFSYRHFYYRKDQYLHTNCFIGIQYGKKKSNFYWYGVTDFSFRYDANTPKILDSGTGNNPKPGDFFTIGPFAEEKTLGFALRQSLGIQYFINSSISVSIEGGASFERYQLSRLGFSFYAFATSSAFNFGQQFYPLKKLWLYNFDVSPLTILTLNYHF